MGWDLGQNGVHAWYGIMHTLLLDTERCQPFFPTGYSPYLELLLSGFFDQFECIYTLSHV